MRRTPFAALAAFWLVLFAALPACAQYTAYTLIGSDGNLYGASGPVFYSYSLTTGVTTVISSNASQLTLCLERSDGTLLGINNDSSGIWQLVKVSLAGQITAIAQFPTNTDTSTSPPACPALDSEGNYYGGADFAGEYGYGFLYELTAAGALNVLYNFTGKADGIGPNTPPVQGSDGNIYYFSGSSLLRYNPTTGLSVTPDSYRYEGSPQEGPTGDFYAIAIVTPSQTGIVQVTTTGTSSVLYDPYNYEYGTEPSLSNLAVLDNQLAVLLGNSYFNQDPQDFCTAPGNDFTFQTLNMAGSSDSAQSFYFLGADETNPYDADADFYAYSLIQGGNGNFYGIYTDEHQQDDGLNSNGYGCNEVTTNEGPYSIQAASTYQSIQMSLSKTHVLPSESTTLSWDVANAYSLTMQQCYGFFGGTGVKVSLTGSLTADAPPSPGAYTFAIICGGTETAAVTLNVGDATLALAASATPVLIGTPVTFTATVTNAATPAPTGSVKFLYGTAVIGTASLANGVAKLTVPTTGLSGGNYVITATYSGDVNYGPAAAPAASITLVPREATTITLSPPTQSITQGSILSLTATPSGTSPFGAPSGTITFMYGSSVLSTVNTVGSSMSATLSVPTALLPIGTYTITANYSGNTYFLPSGPAYATVTLTAPPTQEVSLTISPNPEPAGSPVTLTATTHGTVTPTGAVDFYAGIFQIASANINGSGVAMVTLPSGTLAAGTYGMTAYYPGDSNNPSFTSTEVPLTVQ